MFLFLLSRLILPVRRVKWLSIDLCRRQGRTSVTFMIFQQRGGECCLKYNTLETIHNTQNKRKTILDPLYKNALETTHNHLNFV